MATARTKGRVVQLEGRARPGRSESARAAVALIRIAAGVLSATGEITSIDEEWVREHVILGHDKEPVDMERA